MKTVLCLHAFGQSGQQFRKSTGSFRKLFKDFHFEFVFTDAPHSLEGESDSFAWYFVNKSDRRLEPSGLDLSLAHLQSLLEQHQPNGIIGFSQGASIFALLCSQTDMAAKFPSVKFAMLFGCPLLHKVEHNATGLLGCTIPTLVVSGTSDAVIDCNEGRQLSQLYANSKFLQHEGGHYVPSNSAVKATYLNFLNSLDGGST